MQISDWKEEAWTNSEVGPVLKLGDYKACFPTKSGALAVRAEWIAACKAKLSSSEAHAKLAEMIKAHNAHYNPTGHDHVEGAEGAAQKRALSTDDKERAEELPATDDCPETKDAVLAAHPGAVVLPSHGQELVFCSDGSLYCIGGTDDFFPHDEPICQIYGRFDTGPKATTFLEKDGKGVQLAIKSEDDLVFASSSKALAQEPFPAKLEKFGAFVRYLQEGGVSQADAKLECHNVQMTFQKDDAGEAQSCTISVTPTIPCVFQPLKPANEGAGTKFTVGSMLTVGEAALQWSWPAGTHKSGLLRIMPHIRFAEGRQASGIVPGKPGIYLCRPVKVGKGTVRKWA